MDHAHPHDALFRAAFSSPERAAELLAAALPAEIAAAIDWRTLRLVPMTFVDEALRDRHADLLFTAQANGRTVLVYVLFEHKSWPDPWTSLQVLRYEVRIWDAWRRLHPDARELPPVLPLVLHHGTRPWTAAADLRSIPAQDGLPEAFVALQPQLRFLLVDLSASAELPAPGFSTAVALTLLHLRDLRGAMAAAQLIWTWRDLYRDLANAASPGSRQLLAQLVAYVAAVADDDPQALLRTFAAIHEQAEESIMPFADKMMERGRIQGWCEGLRRGHADGIAEGLRGALTLLLQDRFGPLADQHLAAIAQADTPALERWIRGAPTAGSPDELFA